MSESLTGELAYDRQAASRIFSLTGGIIAATSLFICVAFVFSTLPKGGIEKIATPDNFVIGAIFYALSFVVSFIFTGLLAVSLKEVFPQWPSLRSVETPLWKDSSDRRDGAHTYLVGAVGVAWGGLYIISASFALLFPDLLYKSLVFLFTSRGRLLIFQGIILSLLPYLYLRLKKTESVFDFFMKAMLFLGLLFIACGLHMLRE
ncbi:hypothetical protein [Paenirhodobacter sp.]|uniref:hypothetical protein n=1 Tax=Paenirhodobacter sp. TaxID=1965326 RepID=UPI003B3E3B43